MLKFKWDDSGAKDSEGNSEFFYGVKEGIIWTRIAITKAKTVNFGLPTSKKNKYDQMHKVRLQIPKEYYEADGILRTKFEAVVNDELGGIDDLRIIAYGKSCNTPPMDYLAGDIGMSFDSGCNLQVVYEDFQSSVAGDLHAWGTIEQMGENVS